MGGSETVSMGDTVVPLGGSFGRGRNARSYTVFAQDSPTISRYPFQSKKVGKLCKLRH
ncbi:unannotated protein [freshwater metagenome]|uniref:Unannotated protein n=1 Tax=freshwater metagenome TaxID=449393 RepID=A0A6J6PP13_9ZZZZ